MRPPNALRELRCAIYTRKSSEEGLEQDFNSLHAQREACEAYITSQRHEGWRAIPTAYDDGGYSGGSIDRPGLTKLLTDVASGLIDVVVVYKVDRLTRSLTDFARIVEIFDKHGVSFVSVTQSFNTTTSMGRLTLNVLLSFAQFEREVTGERIRDKIAASKKKGLWMGGWVPLGYEADGRTLTINEPEAAIIRRLYTLYIEHGSVSALEEIARREGLTTKRYEAMTGRVMGGRSFRRGHLYRILANPLYVGAIAHKGQVYEGQHPAIVDRDTWDAVQAQLKQNGREHRVQRRAREPNIFSGLLVDEHGATLTSTHAVKNGKRYRYYVGHQARGEDQPSWRLPAHEIERLVLDEIRTFLMDEHRVAAALDGHTSTPQALKAAMIAASDLATRLAGSTGERRGTCVSLLDRVELTPGRLTLHIRPSPLLEEMPSDSHSPPLIQLAIPASVSRRGETTLVLPGRTAAGGQPDTALIKAIARGYVWFEELATGRVQTIVEIAKREAVTDRYVSCLIKLAFLAPSLVGDTIAGRCSTGLSAKELTLHTDLPLQWSEQEALFAEPHRARLGPT